MTAEPLSKSVVLSLLAHATLVLIFLVRGFLAPTEMMNLQDSIRVDIVGLPEKQQSLPEKAAAPAPAPKAPPPVAAKAKPKPEPVKPKAPEAPKVELNHKKNLAKSQKNALNEIKAMAALDKIKNEVSTKPSAKPVKGNQVNAGSSLTGLEKIDFDRYFHSVEERIRQNWSLPEWLINSPLRAQVLVLIDENGGVIKKQVLKSSGNSEFDERMLDAVEKSAPFPAPPDRLRSTLGMKGIVFNFPQRGDS
jgi:colicin import membrane protein